MLATRRNLALVGACALLGLVPVRAPALGIVWLAVAGLCALVLAVDAVRGLRQARLYWRRVVPGTIAQGVSTAVALRVRNSGTRRQRILVYDLHPAALASEGLPRVVDVPAEREVEVAYRVVAWQRGDAVFDGIDVRVLAPWGLWWHQRRAPVREVVRVYPNYRAVLQYGLLALRRRTGLVGIRAVRRRGQGSDFRELRDYQRGDSLRQIDWRATSRRQRLTSRDYDDERDQQVMFLVDCGRRMHAREGGISLLDHALGAVLMLTYVALRKGDAVGVATVGGDARYLAPRKGQSTQRTILRLLYDVESTAAPTDLAVGLVDLAARLGRRTLVVVVTNLRDEEDPELVRNIRLLRRRHVVLVASMRERVLADMLGAPIEDLDGALRFGATHAFLEARERAHAALRRTGIHHLDVEPRALSTALVNRYLAIKAARVL